jgi:surface protein
MIRDMIMLAAGAAGPTVVPFILEVTTTAPSQSRAFIIQGTRDGNVVIDWGDGVVETNTGNGTVNHTYAMAGVYTVTVSGKKYGIQVQSTDVLQFGAAKFTVLRFNNTGVLPAILSATDNPDLSELADPSFMFVNQPRFNDPRVSNWDTSSFVDMQAMFSGCTDFNQSLNSWNTSKVTTLRNTFSVASSFNTPLNNWDVSKVDDISNIFRGASSFNQPLNNWNVSSATNMTNMFMGASAFNQPLNNWDVSSVTSMSNMFAIATVFNQNLSGWCVTKIPTLPSGFGGPSLQPANYPVWGTCPAPVRPFILRILTLSSNRQANIAFYGPREEVVIDWGDGTITNVPATTSPTDSTTYPKTYALPGGNYTVTITGVRYGFGDLSNSNIGNMITDVLQWGSARFTRFGNNGATGLFASSSGVKLPAVLAAPDNPDLSECVDTSGMFRAQSNLNDPRVSGWDVSSVTNMAHMFAGATAFNQPLDNWNVSKVTNMNNMFFGANAFNQNISNWCVTKIPSQPTGFATGSALPTPYYPVWGTCPATP